jgi:subtilisin family serine protease
LCVLILLLLVFSPVRRAQASDYVPGELIVQLVPGADIQILNRVFGLRILGRSVFAPVYRLGLPLFSLLNVEVLASFLRLDPLVVAAEPNLLVGFPDGTEGNPWSSVFVDHHQNTNQMQMYGMQPSYSQVEYLPVANRADGSGVTVAILDTGISPRHAFIAAQTVPGWNFVANNSNADDMPDGRDNDKNGSVDEGVGHGTMAAGIVYRFAPRAALMPIKVLDSDGSGTLWNAMEGIRYAAANGADVLNLSLGASRPSLLLNLALQYAKDRGAVLVAAAGNNDSTTAYSPAGNDNVITVAALNTDNTKAAFSNYGAKIDVAAPGVSIASTYWDGRYAAWSGTSFAAPMVAAEAALIRSLVPGMSPSAVRSHIINTSVSVNNWNPAYNNQLGAGLVNFQAALADL